ncbi:MAG: glycosyltransferase family 2 protein [Opitutales bacterium]
MNPFNHRELTLICVSYNSYEAVSRCSLSLFKLAGEAVIIVDNASKDTSVQNLRLALPAAQLIELPQNIGYGRAANRALAKVKTPYALLLNPDILAKPSDLTSLLDFAKNDGASGAIWGPRGKHTSDCDTKPRPVDEINGSAMLFEMSKLREIGFFDENIFLFCEEHELCVRTRSLGYEVIECPSIDFGHLEGQSCGHDQATEDMKNWHFGWSHAYFQHKHFPDSAGSTVRTKMRKYRLKSLLSFNSLKRREYLKKYLGIHAYYLEKSAFDENGLPRS